MLNADVYRSEGLGLLSRRIWELRLPLHPCFVRDLFAVPLADGVHLLGAEPITLKGESAGWILSDFAPLLDGTRTIQDLNTALPEVSADSLLDVLHLMHMHGMLEEADDIGSPGLSDEVNQRHGPQEIFFSRYLRVTGHCRNRYDVQRALAAARVTIVGSANWVPLLSGQLEASGVGIVDQEVLETGGPTEETTSESNRAQPIADLVICVGGELQQERLARHYLQRDAAVLFVDPIGLRLGPLTYPRKSACPVCARQQVKSRAEAPNPSEPVHRMWSTALLSRACQQAIGHLTGLFQPLVLGAVESWWPQIGSTELQEMLWLPNCELCGSSTPPFTIATPAGAMENLALLYHRNVAIRPWHIQQPAGMQHHLSGDVQKLAKGAYLAHAGAERFQLPAPTMLERVPDRAIHHPSQTINLTDLSDLLHYSAGGNATPLDDGGFHLRRHTASGGNLGSTEIYVIVPEPGELESGVYHYLMPGHVLERVGSSTSAKHIIERLGSADDVSSRPPRAALIVVSAVQRLRAKYGERGYQYCLLDAGLIAHRVAAISDEIGRRLHPIWEFNDQRLADALNIDGLRLAPTLVLALGDFQGAAACTERTESMPDRRLAGVKWPVGLAARFITSSARAKQVSEPSLPWHANPPLPGDGSTAIPIKRGERSPAPPNSLAGLVASRRSRPMNGHPLRQNELGSLLESTEQGLPASLMPSQRFAPTVLPLVLDVQNIASGAYRYIPGRGEVQKIRPIERAVVRESLLLQKDHDAAAAILYLAVPLAAWLGAYGDRGYRAAALQVGYIVDRLYLTAESLGLAYSASGAFAQAVADDLLGIDGYHLTTIFSFVVGGRGSNA
ncbi:SagB family peptide dehydrogenase [Rhizobium rhizogenes]|uniref:SagB family peptide dehydrogenase n=1 Tax=Rhizobium rhizogenes TaxID=359 RepID=UPI00157219E3|nr:SagB family peptide dehydrogenase [Rhizobium rhizogenes]NTI39357.1 SagB/ThcOx family dehydrogenase [Rhizobium rhizogenes]WEO69268.1 SagB family peptide dehydrogenase [Rhizobium rhizogenes]